MLLRRYPKEIWVLAIGRLLSSIGTGLTLFYLPIFFVNQLELSATLVGMGVASASITGVLGRFLGGVMVDSLTWGRRKTLFLAVFLSGLGAFAFAIATNVYGLFIGNLIMGFGAGLYWPATETMVADLSRPETRRQSFALTRLADSIGLGFGVIFGGLLISFAGIYRLLFVGDGISFWIFLLLLYVLLPETGKPSQKGRHGWNGWFKALSDRCLLTYIVVNCQITTFIALLGNTVPLYLKNFSSQGLGAPEWKISLFFALNLIFSVVFQLPMANLLQKYRYAKSLGLSLMFWGIGFCCVALAGTDTQWSTVATVTAMGLMAIATVSYTPVASALVVELAPDSLRGVYLSINSQCWAIGYFIGPAIGGFAMDQKQPWVDLFWLGVAASIPLGLMVLRQLDKWMHFTQGGNKLI